jgi:predicted outer membrane repeat protein
VGQGGGLILGGVIDVVNSTFANNFATFQGGAIFAGGSANVPLANSLFYQNYLDPTHINPVTSEYQGYHTNRELIIGNGCSVD